MGSNQQSCKHTDDALAFCDLSIFYRLSRRDEVELVNNSRLDQLPGDCETYQAMDIAGWNSKNQRVTPEQMEKLLDRLVVPKTIGLKVLLIGPSHHT